MIHVLDPLTLCVDMNFSLFFWIKRYFLCICHCISGDPSIFGNLEPHPAVKEALRAALDSREAKINGYPHSAGLVEARAAIAEMSSSDSYKLTHEVDAKVYHS